MGEVRQTIPHFLVQPPNCISIMDSSVVSRGTDIGSTAPNDCHQIIWVNTICGSIHSMTATNHIEQYCSYSFDLITYDCIYLDSSFNF